MEARSLAALNHLASNPPQYPVNPSQEKQDPLTLYITRVPGTKDIILSPFKPGLKNVTVEDVASSFYYVHFELLSDLKHAQAAAAAAVADQPRRLSEDGASVHTIRRKPLPTGANPVTPDSRVPSQSSVLLAPPDANSLRGRPRSATTGTTYSYASSNASSTYLAPPPSYDYAVGATPQPAEAPEPEEVAPPLPPRPPTLPPRPRGLNPPANKGDNAPTSPKKSSAAPTPFFLTLIRRDPSSGNQWNVARISSQQLADVLSDEPESFPPTPPAARLLTVPNPPTINIRIDNSGYAKFRHMPVRKSIDGRPPSCHAIQMPPHQDISKPEEGVFSRQVVMGYSKSFTANLKHKFQARRHSRNASEPTDTDATDGPDPASYGQGMKPRGYVFTSPWDGVCEFRTGNGGRSVRCVHTTSEGSSGGFNPLVSGSDDAPDSNQPAVVSELRFNLPSTDVFASDRSKNGNGDGQKGHFSKFFRQDAGSDDSWDDDEPPSPFDVNIGRERAGGGNRGTRAKLGKLIIHNEGLKMLDLVVAANVGVWWGAWEKNS